MTRMPTPAPPSAFHCVGPHLVVPDFFGPATVERLLGFALRRREAFSPGEVTRLGEGGWIDPSRRVSQVLHPIPELEPMVQARIGQILPRVCKALGSNGFAPESFETEMVAHGHGAFFGRHIDTLTGAGSDPASRVISMVYYFCATPARFSGGQLRLHSLAATGEDGTFIDIEPVNDTAIFFPSWFPHEVLPVICGSRKFADSRFAINCWLRK